MSWLGGLRNFDIGNVSHSTTPVCDVSHIHAWPFDISDHDTLGGFFQKKKKKNLPKTRLRKRQDRSIDQTKRLIQCLFFFPFRLLALTMVFSSSVIRASTAVASCLVICKMVEITRRRLRCSPASRVDIYLKTQSAAKNKRPGQKFTLVRAPCTLTLPYGE